MFSSYAKLIMLNNRTLIWNVTKQNTFLETFPLLEVFYIVFSVFCVCICMYMCMCMCACMRMWCVWRCTLIWNVTKQNTFLETFTLLEVFYIVFSVFFCVLCVYMYVHVYVYVCVYAYVVRLEMYELSPLCGICTISMFNLISNRKTIILKHLCINGLHDRYARCHAAKQLSRRE